MKKKKK
jgi:hypothetical protein